MTNSKTTKRALFSSVVALLLCFAMLLGTTFAWFTDTAVSGNNIIMSGNLDMEVSYKPYGAENTEWTEVTDKTVIFGEDALYEPGYTEAVWLKVENTGSLAFRYNLSVNVASEKQGTNKAGAKFNLSDYLEVRYMTTTSTDMESNYYTTRESLVNFAWGSAANSGVTTLKDNIAAIKNGVAYAKNDPANGAYSSSYVLVVISMPTTVGNEANHNGTDIPEIEFALTAVATQLAHESDSFDNQYDKDATYPNTLTSDRNEALEIAAGESLNLDMNEKTIKNTVINNGDVVLSNGTIDTKAEDLAGFESNGGYAELNDVTIIAGSANNYAVILKSDAKLTDVDVNSAGGGIGVVDGAKVEFNGTSVYVDTASTSGRYNFYLEGEGSELTINNGKFSWDPADNQKRAYVYAGAGTTVNITGGTFGKASTRSGYTAGILGEGTVIITGGTFGFDPSVWVADGYVANKIENTWTVTAK